MTRLYRALRHLVLLFDVVVLLHCDDAGRISHARSSQWDSALAALEAAP